MASDAALDPVLRTRQWLSSRVPRPGDPARENHALLALADEMAQRPDNVLTLLCELILETCRADSAGVSLLREETDDFFWPAVAGAWAPFVRGSMPRSASPCGKVIDYDAVLVFRDVPAQFPATRQATPDIAEILLAPFHRDGVPIGTVWAVVHDPERVFDAEDGRVLTSLARFAAAAHQTTSEHRSARQSRESLNAAVKLVGLGLYSIEFVNGESRLTWDDRIRGLWGLAEGTEICRIPGPRRRWGRALGRDTRRDALRKRSAGIVPGRGARHHRAEDDRAGARARHRNAQQPT